MKCPIMIKTALNAQKARALAKSVGLIPREGSQWRWALRNMRKANPHGIKGKALMQTGKELAMTKEKVLGMPKNNYLHKIDKVIRRHSNAREVGGKNILGKTMVVVGDGDSVNVPGQYAMILNKHYNDTVGKRKLLGRIIPKEMSQRKYNKRDIDKMGDIVIKYIKNLPIDYHSHPSTYRALTKSYLSKTNPTKAMRAFSGNKFNKAYLASQSAEDAVALSGKNFIRVNGAIGLHDNKGWDTGRVRSVFFNKK